MHGVEQQICVGLHYELWHILISNTAPNKISLIR